jgi:hypothetical protein
MKTVGSFRHCTGIPFLRRLRFASPADNYELKITNYERRHCTKINGTFIHIPSLSPINYELKITNERDGQCKLPSPVRDSISAENSIRQCVVYGRANSYIGNIYLIF